MIAQQSMGLSRLGLVGLVALWSVLTASGCASPVHLTSEDGRASIEAPGRWVEDRQAVGDGVLLAVSHSRYPVSARLHHLPTRYAAEVLPVRVLTWATQQYSALEEVTVLVVESYPEDIHQVSFVAVDSQNRRGRFELKLVNAGIRSYLLEIWGDEATMASRGPHLVEELFGSLVLRVEGHDEALGATDTSQTIGLSHLRLSLPEHADATGFKPQWRVEAEDSTTLRFWLDGRLLAGVLVHEPLPYPLSAERYAAVALGDDIAVESSSQGVSAPPTTVDGLIPLTRHHRFATHGNDGFQVVVWTPTALEAYNLPLIEALLNSIEVD
jgi:hypothetical protein